MLGSFARTVINQQNVAAVQMLRRFIHQLGQVLFHLSSRETGSLAPRGSS